MSKSESRLFLSFCTYFVDIIRFKVEQGLCKVVYFCLGHPVDKVKRTYMGTKCLDNISKKLNVV